MALKDILVPLFGDESDDALIAAIESLPQLVEAHVAAVLLSPIPDPIFVGDGMVGGLALGEMIADAQSQAKTAQARLQARLSRTNLAFEQRLSQGQVLTVCDHATVQARHADLTVMARPSQKNTDFRHDVLEAVLMESGRPLLLLPTEWTATGGIGKVFVAWNASRAAARALADAAPFLQSAATIVVATIDARPDYRGHGEAPGVDIATHLARHGLAVDLQNLDSLGAEKGEAILSAAQAAGADLIVLGGYGHARLQQALFGGVTRALINTSPLPLFLSH